MNVRLRRLFFAAAALLLPWTMGFAALQGSVAQAQAQSPQASAPVDAQPEVDSPYKLKADATLVVVDVVITDDLGNVLGGLRGGNFRIIDDGKPQQILSFSPTSEPITVVLLMEYSSHSYNYYAAKAADWANAFLNQLDPKDWVALVTYDIKSKVQVDFTHRRNEVREAIYALGFPQFSDANLFDALNETLDKVDGVRSRKSILLLSTGANTFSASTLDEVMSRLRRTNTTIFSVGLAEGEFVRSGGSGTSYVQGKNWLNEFAKRTGGIAFFPRFQGELPDIFRSITGFLRNQYTLAYRLPKEQRDGRYHRIKVEVIDADGQPLKFTDEKGKKRKIIVHAREGYIAPNYSREQVSSLTYRVHNVPKAEKGD